MGVADVPVSDSEGGWETAIHHLSDGQGFVQSEEPHGQAQDSHRAHGQKALAHAVARAFAQGREEQSE